MLEFLPRLMFHNSHFPKYIILPRFKKSNINHVSNKNKCMIICNSIVSENWLLANFKYVNVPKSSNS